MRGNCGDLRRPAGVRHQFEIERASDGSLRGMRCVFVGPIGKLHPWRFLKGLGRRSGVSVVFEVIQTHHLFPDTQTDRHWP